jgi:hypothetical protein
VGQGCEYVRTGTSDPRVRNEEFGMVDVSSTEMKGIRETETCDREYVGNIRKYRRKICCFILILRWLIKLLLSEKLSIIYLFIYLFIYYVLFIYLLCIIYLFISALFNEASRLYML